MSSLRPLSLLFVLVSVVLSVAAQTNLLVNGDFESSILSISSTNGWATPQGTSDSVEGNTRSLSTYGNYTTASAPNGMAYSGLFSLLYESGSLNQSVTQAVAVTGGHQYILSFFLLFTDGDQDSYFQASYQHNTEASATLLLTPASFTSGSAGTAPPFWWSQFKYTINAPSSASSVNITFLGYDRDYGFQLDYATLYDAGVSGNSPTVSAPNAPPALTPNPSNNQLVNGDFESGSVAPWREPAGDNPFPLSTGEGAYDFNGFAPRSGISCPQGNYCFTFGAPYYSLPIQQTVSVSTSQNYTLSFMWSNMGGYNASNPSDAGSLLALSVGWNSGSMTSVFSQVNNTAVTTAATATIQLGTPPSGTSQLTLRFDGYSWPTYNVIDYIVLTSTTSSSPTNNNGVGMGKESSGLMVMALGIAALGAAMLL